MFDWTAWQLHRYFSFCVYVVNALVVQIWYDANIGSFPAFVSCSCKRMVIFCRQSRGFWGIPCVNTCIDSTVDMNCIAVPIAFNGILAKYAQNTRRKMTFYFLTASRSRLLPENVDKLIFLQKNMKIKWTGDVCFKQCSDWFYCNILYWLCVYFVINRYKNTVAVQIR